MKKITVLMVILVLVLLPVTLVGQEAVISQIRGKVEFRISGQPWFQAVENQILPVSSQISTGINSTAQLRINDSVVTIQPLTRLTLEEISQQANQETTRLNLNTGRVSAQVRSASDRAVTFEVRSPIATASVRGTDFDFDGVQLQVSEGSVQVVNRRNQTILVAAGGQTTASSTAPPKPPAEVLQQQTQSPPSTLPPEPSPPAPPAPPASAPPAATPALPLQPSSTSVRVDIRIPLGSGQ